MCARDTVIIVFFCPFFFVLLLLHNIEKLQSLGAIHVDQFNKPPHFFFFSIIHFDCVCVPHSPLVSLCEVHLCFILFCFFLWKGEARSLVSYSQTFFFLSLDVCVQSRGVPFIFSTNFLFFFFFGDQEPSKFLLQKPLCMHSEVFFIVHLYFMYLLFVRKECF